MTVPYSFGTATSAIPLSQLDSNFNTPITLGNTAIQLGNTVTTLNNMTLANVTITSGSITLTSITDSGLTSGRVTYATTGGLLTDSANFTYNGTNLGITGTTSDVKTVITATTGSPYTQYTNSSGSFYVGKENSTGTSFGVTAYSSVIFGEGNYPLLFCTNSTKQMTLDSSGNLGLGVTPSSWGSTFRTLQFTGAASIGGTTDPSLQISQNAYYNGTNWVYSTTAAASNYNQAGGVHTWRIASSGSGNITWTQAMTLDASGNLGIGTTSPVTRLDVSYAPDANWGTANFFDPTSAAQNVGGVIALSGYKTSTSSKAIFAKILGAKENATAGNEAGYLAFYTNSSSSYVERARIDSSGNLLVGQTSASVTTAGIYVGGINSETTNTPRLNICGATASSIYYGLAMYSTGAGAYRFYVNWGGTINATSTTITGISDVRLKENIRDLDDGLDIVLALKPRKFDWKEGKGADIKNARGFIAQEFEQVLPDMIHEWADPAPEGEEPYKAINANLIPTLVKAIQEQQAIIETLTARITALEGAKA